MLRHIALVFDGKAFVPTEPVELPVGTRATVVVLLDEDGSVVPVTGARQSPMTPEEAERILRGDGTPLPWATVEAALGRPRYEP